MEGELLVILLVEDNLDHTELVMRSFENHRVANKIHHVCDGQAALAYLFRRGDYTDPRRSPRPHVILLDLRLPKVDGVEVLKQIKDSKDLRRIPVVILSSSETEKDMAGAYENHANSYIVKPVDFEKFAQLMDDLGFYWLAWNRSPELLLTCE